jgi:hypothetical protein
MKKAQLVGWVSRFDKRRVFACVCIQHGLERSGDQTCATYSMKVIAFLAGFSLKKRRVE